MIRHTTALSPQGAPRAAWGRSQAEPGTGKAEVFPGGGGFRLVAENCQTGRICRQWRAAPIVKIRTKIGSTLSQRPPCRKSPAKRREACPTAKPRRKNSAAGAVDFRGIPGSLQFASNPTQIRIRIYTQIKRLPGNICRMSTVGSTISVVDAMAVVNAAANADAIAVDTTTSAASSTSTTAEGMNAAGRRSVQIAVPNPSQLPTSDVVLEAAIRRIAMMLYVQSHCTNPPKAQDMGGGLFNVLV
jgi:hypothetical protein